MDLLSKDALELVNETFPKRKLTNGQIWFDTLWDRHGMVIGNMLHFIDGSGFTTIHVPSEQVLYQPTVQDFLWLLPGCKIETWGGLFSVKFDHDEYPKRFSEANPLLAMAKMYIHRTKK